MVSISTLSFLLSSFPCLGVFLGLAPSNQATQANNSVAMLFDFSLVPTPQICIPLSNECPYRNVSSNPSNVFQPPPVARKSSTAQET